MKKLRELPLQTHLQISTGLIISGLLIVTIAEASSQDGINAGTWIGFILIICGIVWHILFVRCPHCGSLLHIRGGIPKYCPECGKYIDKFH